MADEHADRHAIETGLDLYAAIIDAHEYERLEEVFLRDAVLDYSSSGATPGPLEEVAAWIEKGLSLFARTAHMITNKIVTVNGDEAHSRALFFNPLVTEDGKVFFVGGAYVDQWRRTPLGWRIIDRVEEMHWTYGFSTPPVTQNP
jgi:hypothetical protein